MTIWQWLCRVYNLSLFVSLSLFITVHLSLSTAQVHFISDHYVVLSASAPHSDLLHPHRGSHLENVHEEQAGPAVSQPQLFTGVYPWHNESPSLLKVRLLLLHHLHSGHGRHIASFESCKMKQYTHMLARWSVYYIKWFMWIFLWFRPIHSWIRVSNMNVSLWKKKKKYSTCQSQLQNSMYEIQR